MVLTEEELAAFRKAVSAILVCDKCHEVKNDFVGASILLKQLWSSVSPEEFEIFADIIWQATTSDFRSPK